MFCINATAANTAPTITPKAVKLVPANLFTAATATKTTTTNARIPNTTHVIGQANKAAFKPQVAIVADKVAPFERIKAAACIFVMSADSEDEAA
ncbi:Uncharacterised protein [Clostridioides difficile]|nr:Uncharacterised protein [Clostridioides difficile]